MTQEDRRSGFDRRDQKITITVDRRLEIERRAAIRDSQRIIAIMKTTSIFKELTIEQYNTLLNICSHNTFPNDHVIYHKGDESNELYILIRGHLKVLSHRDVLLESISPIGIVGEIDVFTGRCRSTTVITTTESSAIVISKTELFKLFLDDGVLSSHILLNVIYDLAQKCEAKQGEC